MTQREAQDIVDKFAEAIGMLNESKDKSAVYLVVDHGNVYVYHRKAAFFSLDKAIKHAKDGITKEVESHNGRMNREYYQIRERRDAICGDMVARFDCYDSDRDEVVSSYRVHRVDVE